MRKPGKGDNLAKSVIYTLDTIVKYHDHSSSGSRDNLLIRSLMGYRPV